MRKQAIVTWERSKAGFWDSAVKGSSPLRAAVLRQLKAETCGLLNISWVQLLWDAEKFYDLIQGEQLAVLAGNLEYPLVPFYLAMLQHMADRWLAVGTMLSDSIQVNHSIIAGCMQSVAWSRIYLWDMLDNIHRSYPPPQNTIGSWVDDLAQLNIGTAEG
eukprot:769510-Pyramimonas_sp.AAC.1